VPGAEPADLRLRRAVVGDLDAVNRVIERAVMSWNLAERVKRLSLPMYRYDAVDFDALDMVVAEQADGAIIGVAAWERADADAPAGATAVLLHGIYVDPDHHRKGVGSRLLEAAEQAARGQGLGGLLVKAQRDAEGFFLARGFERLPVADAERHYPHRLWKAVGP
jgi:N-acetylglutamate synthase-like GNAT family acetyltransferase